MRLNNNGFTLVEVMVMSIIVAVALASLYVSILYTETQMVRNYHERKAYLLASGQLELCQQRQNNQNASSDVRDLYSKINGIGVDTWDAGNIYIVNEGESVIIPSIRVVYTRDTDNEQSVNLPYIRATAEITYEDPTYPVNSQYRRKKIKAVEDFYSYYIPSQGSSEGGE